MPKPSLQKNHSDSSGDKKVQTFAKGISLKVNATVWLKFELAYFEVIVQHVNHYAIGTLLMQINKLNR